MIQSTLVAATEGNALPVISGVFPLIALGVFALLGAITWSYRDVAGRHSQKTGGSTPHGPTH